MQNRAYRQQNMHEVKICTKNYANGKKSQVDTAWRSHPSTANRAYQQLSDTAHLIIACVPLASRLHSSYAYQLTHNR